MIAVVGGHEFRIERDQHDVTQLSRPDPGWSTVDPTGHQHGWDFGGPFPTTPSLEAVEIGYITDQDGEPYPLTEHRCRACGAVVEPGYRADEARRFAAGRAHYSVDGRPVEPDEFWNRMAEARRAAGAGA